MAPQIRFFLSCDRRHFYAVEIYASPDAMHAAIAALTDSPVRANRNARAMCVRYTARDKRNRVTPELGTIFFVRGDTPLEVVIHELTHAAVGWAKRVGLQPTQEKEGRNDPEEKFADVVHELVAQFYQKAPTMLALFEQHRAAA